MKKLANWKKRAASLTMTAVMILISVSSEAQTINYQGYVADAAGAVNGATTMHFSIYDADALGNELWSELHLNVPVIEGIANVELGSVNPVNVLPFDQQYWLQIAVDEDNSGTIEPAEILSPRKKLTAVPQAMNALSADSVDWQGVANIPADLADGDDNTEYTAGNGIALDGTVLSVDVPLELNQPVFQGTRASLATTTTGVKGENPAFGTSGELGNSLAGVIGTNSSGGFAGSFTGDVRVLGGELIFQSSGSGLTFNDGTTQTTAGLSSAAFDVNANGKVDNADSADQAVNADTVDGLHSTSFQKTVTGSCLPGSSIRQVMLDGTVTCEPDNDTGADTSVVQSRVTGSCPAGSSISGINQDGTVSCELDNDTRDSLDSPDGQILDALLVDNAGNVGIGNPFPSDKLSVNGVIETTQGGIRFPDGTLLTTAASGPTGIVPRSPVRSEISLGTDEPSVTIGADGLPFITYKNFNSFITAKCLDAGCTSVQEVVFPGGSSRSSVVMGAEGYPVIAQTRSDSSLYIITCADHPCIANNSIRKFVDTSVSNSTPSIIDGGGITITSYYGGTQDLKMVICGSYACPTFTLRTIASAGDVGRYSSVAYGADGLPVVAYYGSTNNTIRLARCLDADCTTNEKNLIDSGQGEVHMTIGNDGFPVILYAGLNNFLKVAKCNDLSCATSTTTEIAPYHVSSDYGLTISADGLPVIVYQYVMDLNVYKCSTPDCTTGISNRVIDADVSNLTVTMGADGLPFIVYKDGISLRTFKCPSAFCNSFGWVRR